MSTPGSSFLERLIRAITRGAIPVDASQCDGACVVQSPVVACESQHDPEADRQSQIRWLNVR